MESHPELSTVVPVAKSDEKRWGMFSPFLTAGFRPATTARRTDHLSWTDALIVHVFAVFLVVIAMTFSIAWSEADADEGLANDPVEVILLWDDVLHEFSSMPLGFGLLVLVAIHASCWGGYVLFAIVLSSWGARDEPVRESVCRAIRRAWRHTPHVLQVVVLTSIVAVPFFRAHQQASERVAFHDVDVVLASFPEAERGQPDAWWRARQIAWESYPFYVRHGGGLGLTVLSAGVLWLLRGFLSAIGAGGKGLRIARPPMCEACGYNLTGAAMEGRCPECGSAVMDSFGPNVRSGTSWQRRIELGRWAAFWRTTIDALLRPTQVGRQLIPSPVAGDHRVFLRVWLPLIFICTWGGWLLCCLAMHGQLPRGPDLELFWQECLLLGCLVAINAVFFVLIVAGLVGFLGRWKHKRNMMPSAMQAACCAGGFLIVWVVVAFCGWAVMLGHRWFVWELLRPYGVGLNFVAFALKVGPSAICFLIYLWLVARIARGTRFANRRSLAGCSEAC